MTTINWLRIIRISVAATLLGAGSSAANTDPQNRIQIVVRPMRYEQADRGLSPVEAPKASMLHHFRVEVVDSTGAPISAPLGWDVEIRMGGIDCDGASIRLTSEMTELSLPKPLGLRVDAGQAMSVSAVAQTPDNTGQRAYLRLTIEYDDVEAGLTRFAVVPVSTQGLMAIGSSQGTWEWRAQANARLLALAGSTITEARDLVLEDLDAGTVIWRATDRDAPLAFSNHNSYVRLGVELVAGHAYRLTAVASKGRTLGNTSVIALALPQ